MGMMDERMIHTPGGTQRDRARFHHKTRDGAPCNTDGLFTSGMFHLIFPDLRWLP